MSEHDPISILRRRGRHLAEAVAQVDADPDEDWDQVVGCLARPAGGLAAAFVGAIEDRDAGLERLEAALRHLPDAGRPAAVVDDVMSGAYAASDAAHLAIRRALGTVRLAAALQAEATAVVQLAAVTLAGNRPAGFPRPAGAPGPSGDAGPAGEGHRAVGR